MANFEDAIGVILKNEGGYTNDPNDKGGKTRFGISKKSYPDVDIENITEKDAIAIYKRDFWDKLGLDQINNQAIATKIFDMAVNMGIYYAVVCAQRALRSSHINIIQDGKLGNQTISYLNVVDPIGYMCAYRSECAAHYRQIDDGNYLEGWLNRAYQ